MAHTTRIGIDARLIAQTGVGRYISNLIQELVPLCTPDTKLYIYIRSQDIHLVKDLEHTVTIRIADYQWHTWQEQFGFYRQIMKDKLDLMHFTYFSYPILYRRPFVITIHDLTPLTYATGQASTKHPFVYNAKYFAYVIALRIGLKQSSAVIVPTQTVADEIIRDFGINPHKTHVTYEGIGSDLLRCKPTKHSPYPGEKYFLYVGNMYPHKNIPLLVRALNHVKTPSLLVLVGAEDHFTQKIRTYVQDSKLEDRVIFAGQVTDATLADLYTHACALVHPSQAEGFGLTPLESIYFKTPVIASRLPIFDEILGDSYTPIDPNDEFSLAEALQDHLHSKHTPTMTPQDITNRYSFSTMAHKTYDIYLSCLPQRR